MRPPQPRAPITEVIAKYEPHRGHRTKQVVSAHPPPSPQPNEDMDTSLPPKLKASTHHRVTSIATTSKSVCSTMINREARAFTNDDRFDGVYDNIQFFQNVGHYDPKGIAMPPDQADSPLSQLPDDLANEMTSGPPVSVPNNDTVTQAAQKKKKELKPSAAPAKHNPTHKNRANGF